MTTGPSTEPKKPRLKAGFRAIGTRSGSHLTCPKSVLRKRTLWYANQPSRRIASLSALRGPSWLLPNPDSFETVQRITNQVLERVLSDWRKVPKGNLALCGRALVIAGERKRIPRCLMPD